MRQLGSVVVDSSVIVKWITAEKENLLSEADKLLKDAQREQLDIVSPTLAVYEAGNAIRFKKFSQTEKIICLENLYSLPIKYYTSNFEEAQLAIKIALEHKITYYDAVFIVLAQKLDSPLITANPKHQKRFPGVKVIPLEKYK